MGRRVDIVFVEILLQLLGDFFPASFNCPHEIERLGAMGDGGKWVCGISRLATKPDCVVYSFGASPDFEYRCRSSDVSTSLLLMTIQASIVNPHLRLKSFRKLLGVKYGVMTSQ